MPRVLIFGDSITWGASDPEGGWTARLRKWVDERMYKDGRFDYPIYNLGVSGDKTEDLLKHFDVEVIARLVKDDRKPIIVFAIGTNDSQYLENEQRKRVTLEQFTKNIQELIAKARGYASKIIFIGLLPVDEAKTIPVPWAPEKSYKNEHVKEFDDIIKSQCQQNDISFVDIFSYFSSKSFKVLLEDGLHPNAEGHQKLFEKIRDFLTENSVIA